MSKKSGFTLIEVLVATMVFALAIMGLVASRTSSLRNMAESQRMFEATLLAQSKMAESVAKYQAKLNKGGLSGTIGEEKGKFEAPHEDFSWSLKAKESTMKFSAQAISELMKSLGVDSEVVEQQMQSQALLLTNLNKVLKENLMELEVVIEWQQFGRTMKLPVVTMMIPEKLKFQLTTTADTTGD